MIRRPPRSTLFPSTTLSRSVAKAKEKSEVLLESPREDPLLVRWQYGLGRTAAFTSDLKDRWAVNWLRWNGYSKFWSQLVRETVDRKSTRLNSSHLVISYAVF